MIETLVNQIISLDKEYMSNKHVKYIWYETEIKMTAFLDEETDGSISSITNLFQYLDSEGQPHVVFFTHLADGTNNIVEQDDFCLENSSMNDDIFRLTYKEAFTKAMESNLPKPHSCYCIIRKPIGPYDCNVQYVFGNDTEQIWVDAITGETRPNNPSYGN